LSAVSKTFGGRYEVLERVGTGGMAEVYRARDDLLGRDVAVKVLSERFAGDRSFVERFRREAQAAANLNHPNIVSLYDYGSDNGTYFIVMEYIDGRPLDDVIRAEGALLPERATDIAADVAQALQRAHSSGLVHRDIKPSNIMITSSGQTKVTDFGIARAMARDGEQTMTQTGMVIGTAAYLSPEQAQGRPVDARSDVYSLGCVLYEMLTARPPFTGDTPLSIAYKHVREDPAPPSRTNPDVPRPLDAVVMKAMAKNPDNRYPTAMELKTDLDRFLAGQKVEATPLLSDDTVVGDRVAATSVLREPEYEPEERRRNVLPLVLLGLLLVGLLGALAWFVLGAPPTAADVRVPNVVGERESDAVARLDDRGLDWEITRRFSDRPEGVVFEQDPVGGRLVEEGATITLSVSRGVRQVTVPELVGSTVEEARRILEDRRLRLGGVTRQADPTVPQDQVISQDPAADERVDENSPVNLVVSSGPEVAIVPFVEGQEQSEAEAEIQAAGLIPEVDTQPSAEVEEGFVIAQEPPGGTRLEQNDVVRILVSEGSQETPLPDVTGQDAATARAALEALGLEVDDSPETEPCTEPPGTVCRTDPPPGIPVAEGDEVTLFVQTGGDGGD
jgi:beta-lactam-binding protein with PASTA domain/predicted Ser/Thr protein kinase